MKKITLLILSLSIILGAFSFWLSHEIHSQRPYDVTLYIPPKSSTRDIYEILRQHSVASTPIPYYLLLAFAKFSDHFSTLKHGEYLILGTENLWEVLTIIAQGRVVIHKITIPEGQTVAQIVRKVLEIPFLVGDIALPIQEGNLLPETYTYKYGDSRQSLIDQMEKAMKDAVQELWPHRQERVTAFVKTPLDLITMASIIEKETGVPKERDHVAGVFYNRLEKNMPLQSDPTVIYALTLGANELGRSLTRSDLSFDSEYNTYKTKGLPPTPIACPGKDSLKAAANPKATDALYFVANGFGGHNFSSTLEEHNLNVAQWRALKKSPGT